VYLAVPDADPRTGLIAQGIGGLLGIGAGALLGPRNRSSDPYATGDGPFAHLMGVSPTISENGLGLQAVGILR
jgi:hypothetical protein